jgi:RNA polymerase sigma factor (sigma-70 family)
MTSPSVKLLRTQTDERLVALAAAGHERAFEAIVERYRRPLLRHCRRYLPEARAEDALQQALVSAWSALRRGDEVHALRPWLHRIVHNTSLNALRAAGYDYEQLRDTLHGGGGPAELAERSAVVRQTLAGLAALPERQREALLQIAVEGRSQDQVAEELGLSHGAVRQLVHRARTSLRTAATALMPLPLAGWLAADDGARGDMVARVGELVAGAGGGATLAKAGAVAALAGGAVGGPVVADRIADGPREPARRAAIAAPARADRGAVDAVATPASEQPRRSGDDGDRSGGRGGMERSDGSDDDRSGRRRGDDDDDRSGNGGDDDDDRSGRGGGDEGEDRDAARAEHGVGDEDDGDRSGPDPGSGDDDSDGPDDSDGSHGSDRDLTSSGSGSTSGSSGTGSSGSGSGSTSASSGTGSSGSGESDDDLTTSGSGSTSGSSGTGSSSSGDADDSSGSDDERSD